VRERCSLSTPRKTRGSRERFLTGEVPPEPPCHLPWHMARAVALFSRAGVAVEPVAAAGVVVAWPPACGGWASSAC